MELRHGARSLAVPYLDVDRAELLEYDIASALGLLVRERTPRVAVLSPLVAPSAIRKGREGLSVLAELRATSDLAVVPYFADALPEDIDVLLVIDATVLKRAMLHSIDRFVAKGGTLIVLLDPFVRFNRASQRTRPTPSDELDDITDLVARFGFRFDVGEVVGDEWFAAPVSIGGAGARGYPFWIRVPRKGLAASHPVTGALRELLFAEPGSLDIDAGRGVVPLAFTSAHSGVLARERFANATPDALASEFVANGESRVLAAYASGPFTSAVTGTEGEDTARVFVVADVDWIFDPFSVEVAGAAGGTLTRPINDNRAFLANMIELGSGAAPLAQIRSRGRLRRPFTRFERLFREGEGGYAGRAVGAHPPDIGRRAAHREAARRVRHIFAAAAARRSRGDGDRDSPQASAAASPRARDTRADTRRSRGIADPGDCRQLRRTRRVRRAPRRHRRVAPATYARRRHEPMSRRA